MHLPQQDPPGPFVTRFSSIDALTRERLLASGRTVVEIVLVGLLAVQAARLTWLLIVAPGPFAHAQPLTSSGAGPAASFVDAFHPAGAPVIVADTGDEALGYRLLGLRAALDEGKPASAIIAGPDKVQRAYQVGDAVSGDITLTAVRPGHAMLRSQGIEHRLSLSGPTASPPSTSATSLPTAGEPARSGTSTITSGSSDDAVDLAPAELISNTGLRANLEGGYTLMPRGDGGFFQRAGLQPGDILTAVDGRPLDLERLQSLEEELEGRSETVLTVKRGNQTRTITLQAKQP